MTYFLFVVFAFWTCVYVSPIQGCSIYDQNLHREFPNTKDFCTSSRCVTTVQCSQDQLPTIENEEEVKFFTLSQYKSQTLPAGLLSKMTQLEYVDVANTKISTLEINTFAGLTQLKALRLNENKLSTLPGNIFAELTDLRYLEITEPQLTSLPDDIFSKLKQISYVSIHAPLTQVCGNIFQGLASLKDIKIIAGLHELPEGILSEASELETLRIAGTELKSIRRDVFGTHPNLKTIDVAGNKLTEIEEFFFTDFPSLKKLNLEENNISQLPKLEKGGSSSLEVVDLKRNNITVLSEEVLRSWLVPSDTADSRVLVLGTPENYWALVSGYGSEPSVPMQLLSTESLSCVLDDPDVKKDVLTVEMEFVVPSDNECFPCGKVQVSNAAVEFCVHIPCSHERTSRATFKDWTEGVRAGWKPPPTE